MQNPRNPFTFLNEIGSSSSSSIYIPRTEIGSSSSTIQNPTKETGSSSSSRIVNPRRQNASYPRQTRVYRPSRIGKIIIDPIKNDSYLLKNEIGSSSNGTCRVYKALFSEYSEETKELTPSGYVTLKIINRIIFENECRELQRKIDVSEGYSTFINLIGLKNTFDTEELSCVSLPYMSHGSLRYILSTRPEKKLPEEFIAIVLKEVLIGLQDELHHNFNPRVHKTLNAGDIFVDINDANGEMLIKLAYEASVYDSEDISVEGNTNEEEDNSCSVPFLDPKRIARWGAAPEVLAEPKSDIWLLGITALELAYGVLPVRNREELDRIIKKIKKKKKRFPTSLEKLLVVKKKKKWRFKKAMGKLFKRKAFSKKFEKMVRQCLSKNPKKRPTAKQLLNSSFFTKQRDIERFRQFVLNVENN
ncbi:serine/threonine-protein kinase BLUS1-like [Solanum dulcamara]|uniref:serine/threonine-protein kinase BLUS1-like n=1 Tax=Solanum dulcamara TaxID=45834 RepID=UPI0024860C39|nr:serine/threonine-protein kinase BLUS1-like [Solanum dulcamara]